VVGVENIGSSIDQDGGNDINVLLVRVFLKDNIPPISEKESFACMVLRGYLAPSELHEFWE
jgi:hypothetical protein